MKLQIIIRERKGMIFEGPADRFTSENEIGQFDILPGHMSFVATLQNEIVLLQGKQKKNFKVESGIVRVKNDKIEVFVGV